MDKGMLFLVLGLACLWLVLDEVYGNKFISQFVVKIVPSAEDE